MPYHTCVVCKYTIRILLYIRVDLTRSYQCIKVCDASLVHGAGLHSVKVARSENTRAERKLVARQTKKV